MCTTCHHICFACDPIMHVIHTKMFQKHSFQHMNMKFIWEVFDYGEVKSLFGPFFGKVRFGEKRANLPLLNFLLRDCRTRQNTEDS